MRARWQWIGATVMALAGCLPQPDATGRVACGPEGVCPADFVCRFGRCCPSNAGIAACPTQASLGAADDTGALACDDQGRCPEAFGYECRQGRYCCPRDANPASGPCARGAIGNPCTAMTSCVSPRASANADGGASAAGVCRERVFLNLVPLTNGYCSAGCETSDLASCGADGVCLDLSVERLCVARCRLPEGAQFGPCRNEPNGQRPAPYVCLPLAPNDPSGREGYCYPDCTVQTAICSAGSRCNPQSHRCEEDCTAGTNCGVNRQCNTTTRQCEDNDCRTNVTCDAMQVCDRSTGKCERRCTLPLAICPLGKRCNSTSGLCE